MGARRCRPGHRGRAVEQLMVRLSSVSSWNHRDLHRTVEWEVHPWVDIGIPVMSAEELLRTTSRPREMLPFGQAIPPFGAELVVPETRAPRTGCINSAFLAHRRVLEPVGVRPQVQQSSCACAYRQVLSRRPTALASGWQRVRGCSGRCTATAAAGVEQVAVGPTSQFGRMPGRSPGCSSACASDSRSARSG